MVTSQQQPQPQLEHRQALECRQACSGHLLPAVSIQLEPLLSCEVLCTA